MVASRRQRSILLVILWTMLDANLPAQLLTNLGGQRVGISSLQFLKIPVDARGAAMGESMVATAEGASALFWNPAAVVLSENDQVTVSHANWLVELKHDYLAATYHLTSADVVGLSCISLRTDDMPVTTETQPTGTGTYFSYSDLAVGLTYSRKMTAQFSFGSSIRYVEEDLAAVKIKTVLLDLGTYYSIGLGTARIGVVVANFGADVSPSGDVTLVSDTTITSYQKFSPPTVFKVGFAFEPLLTDVHLLTTSIQLCHPNDNAENIRFGVEYAWNHWLIFRGGLKRTVGQTWLGKDQSCADDWSLGLGIAAPLSMTRIAFDYSCSNYNLLGYVHRITCTVAY